jgi:hypothetical protein
MGCGSHMPGHHEAQWCATPGRALQGRTARMLERWHTFCFLTPARFLTVRDHRPPGQAVSYGEALPEDIETPGIGHGSTVGPETCAPMPRLGHHSSQVP